jgi:iron(III) transport system substrate-binding protein
MIALLVAGAILLGEGFLSRTRGPRKKVVVYTSVDQVHAREVFRRFVDETGIAVEKVFDIEAHKTTGLYHRIRDERSAPVADVFWNSEASRTEQLKREGILQAYPCPFGADIPGAFRDPEGFWYGFGARARVIVYHTGKLVEGPPRSIFDLLRPEWRGRVGIADPRYGTTASHVAALFAIGPDRAVTFLEGLEANEVRVVGGNSVVRDLVARGDLWAGLTDTDDVWVGKDNGHPIEMAYPDQEAGGLGTLVIPNTVALIKGAPHPEEGKAFIDFLVTRKNESMLARGPARQIPVRLGVPPADEVIPIDGIRTMTVTVGEIVDRLPESQTYVSEHFLPR